MGVRSTVTAVAAAALLVTPAAAVASTTDGVTVTGGVWLDLDGDGVRGADEPGRAGVQVALRTSATILDAVVTGPDGDWTFGNVPPGSYTVTLTTPLDLEVTGGTLTGLDADEAVGAVTVGTTDLDAGDVGLGSGVSTGPDVTATISLDAAASDADTYVWTVGAANVGPDAATGPIDVRVVLTADHRAQEVRGDGWSCETSDAIVLCTAPGDVAAGAVLPTLTVVTAPTGALGTTVSATATVRLDGTFDGAPLNDEATASTVISSEAGTDGDPAPDIAEAGSAAASLALTAVLALAVGAGTLRAARRT